MYVSCYYRGYIEAVREIEQQIQLSGDVQFDDIVVACGRYFSMTCYFLHSIGMYGHVFSCLLSGSCCIFTF
jgi:1-aminocyclopropane-1-carboxylate deaminase/D-cysteine desulfhydrase-like pyridoxal-dependent ACC family enzyme